MGGSALAIQREGAALMSQPNRIRGQKHATVSAWTRYQPEELTGRYSADTYRPQVMSVDDNAVAACDSPERVPPHEREHVRLYGRM